jgi:hypothetical protein
MRFFFTLGHRIHSLVFVLVTETPCIFSRTTYSKQVAAAGNELVLRDCRFLSLPLPLYYHTALRQLAFCKTVPSQPTDAKRWAPVNYIITMMRSAIFISSLREA